MNPLQKEKIVIETRAVKHRDVNKIKRNTWITLGIIGLITIAAFSYLLVWLFGKESNKALPAAPTVTAPSTVPQGNTPKNEPVVKTVPNAAGENSAKGTGTTDKPSDSNVINGQAPDSKPAANPKGNAGQSSVKLTFIGDVMFSGNVEQLLIKNGWDYPYRYMKEYLEKADITIANLETPISTRGTAQIKDYTYRSSPEALPALKASGVDLVNTANNHILDYGSDALLDTMDALDQVDIKRVGTGRNIEEAYKPVIMERNGIKIAFLGFSRNAPDAGWYAGKQKPGVAETYSTKLPLEAIANAREVADLVVVIAHWGIERQDVAAKEQTDLAHKYIDEGADLVVASHPHVLQGFEQYNGKWIAYSLGNFIFTTNAEPMTWETMVLDAECTKDRKCELQMLPVLTKGAQPVRMPEAEGLKLFERMSRISFNAAVNKDGKISVVPAKKPVSDIVAPAKPPAVDKPADKKTGEVKPVQPAKSSTQQQPTQNSKPNTTPSTSKPSQPGAANP
ncbi:poly-gamma-glutamate synthesis protein (capsule biosynthesis protein) [Paenibacillus sp. 1_12]|uniref:CapA family protein n=1 Tax=Paenibacillus sp. 1_12 TaxID=1566278 RepID=UPI0008E5C99A|nr:CapA family protein [Paenibacillus sp. 1_12]SFL26543.1 poly-gamma-glutamate synthesis protein (capsule biosynthesis protein) [Paenibacillus sp. 1_12]